MKAKEITLTKTLIKWKLYLIEYFLNIYPEFAKLSDKICVITVNGLEPATSDVRDQDDTTMPATHVRDRIFELTLIHASVIFQIP